MVPLNHLFTMLFTQETNLNFVIQIKMEERIKKINEIIKAFREKSEHQQGYIHIEFNHGIHVCSSGEITYRIRMSGGADGSIEFNSFTQLEEIMEELNRKTYKELAN